MYGQAPVQCQNEYGIVIIPQQMMPFEAIGM